VRVLQIGSTNRESRKKRERRFSLSEGVKTQWYQGSRERKKRKQEKQPFLSPSSPIPLPTQLLAPFSMQFLVLFSRIPQTPSLPVDLSKKGAPQKRESPPAFPAFTQLG
jgi:hypothetical protein